LHGCLALQTDSRRYRGESAPSGKERHVAEVMKSTDSFSLAEVVDRILDKGIVIDAWAKVSLVGIEILSIEARVVIASVETYLKYAEAIGLTATASAPLASYYENEDSEFLGSSASCGLHGEPRRASFT